MGNLVKKKTPVRAYRRSENLRDILVRATLKPLNTQQTKHKWSNWQWHISPPRKPYPALAYRWHNNGPPTDAYANYGQSTMATLWRHKHQRAPSTTTRVHPDAPRHHKNTQSHVIWNVKTTFLCEACNCIFHTRHQHDIHRKLNHRGQQHRCFHCHTNFRTVKERIAHAITVHPKAQAKSYPPGVYPQVIFGHHWNATKSTFQRKSNPGHKISKSFR